MPASVIDRAAVERARATEPRHVAAQRAAVRDDAASTPDRPVWWLHGHRIALQRLDSGAYLACCVCPAAQHGRACYHLAVVVDEEMVRAEAARARGAYAAAKHLQAC